MTDFGTQLAALLAAGAVAAGGVVGAESGDDVAPATAVVVDAALARDGRELVDDRLRSLDAELRVPRTPAEARTNVHYLAARHHPLVVAGPQARAAAEAAGVEAVRTSSVAGAVAAAVRR
jgi:hypothetical protein